MSNKFIQIKISVCYQILKNKLINPEKNFKTQLFNNKKMDLFEEVH